MNIFGKILSGNIGIDLLVAEYMAIKISPTLKKVRVVSAMNHIGFVLIVAIVLAMKRHFNPVRVLSRFISGLAPSPLQGYPSFLRSRVPFRL